MTTNENQIVYVGNPNQHIMNQEANASANCRATGLIMFGVFFCFPGIFLTALGISFIAGPILLCIGLILLGVGVMLCVKLRKKAAADAAAGGTFTTTTVQHQPYVVEQGETRQNVTMQTNVHPTTTVYQAGPPQTTTMYHQIGTEPAAAPAGFSPPGGPGYPPSNPGYPTAGPGYQPAPSQDFAPIPPPYDDAVKTEKN